MGWISAGPVACGASGRSSAGLVAVCAGAEAAMVAARAERRSVRVRFIPCSRLNHAAGGLPEARVETVNGGNEKGCSETVKK